MVESCATSVDEIDSDASGSMVTLRMTEPACTSILIRVYDSPSIVAMVCRITDSALALLLKYSTDSSTSRRSSIGPSIGAPSTAVPMFVGADVATVGAAERYSVLDDGVGDMTGARVGRAVGESLGTCVGDVVVVGERVG